MIICSRSGGFRSQSRLASSSPARENTSYPFYLEQDLCQGLEDVPQDQGQSVARLVPSDEAGQAGGVEKSHLKCVGGGEYKWSRREMR